MNATRLHLTPLILTKIFSMPYMTYEDYRKTSLKHLKTCEYMIQNLHNISDNDSLDGLTKSQWKGHILRNIYYLCGYAIEGIVNYCIYKKVGYPIADNIESLKIDKLREHGTNFNFPLNRGLCFNWNKQGDKDVFYYSINNHNFQKNIKFLSFIEPSKFNHLQVVNNPRNPSIKNSVLFYDWNVKIRYQSEETNYQPDPKLELIEDEILDYFIFVRDELYSKLPTL